MKQKLEEARAIVGTIIADVTGEYPVGLIRVHRLLNQVLADWWDDEDVAVLAMSPDEETIELTEEPPFPAA